MAKVAAAPVTAPIGPKANAPPEPPMSHPDCSVASAELRSRGGTLSTISDCIAGWSIPKPSPLRTPDAMNSRRISAVASMNMPTATTSSPGTITAPLPSLSETVPESRQRDHGEDRVHRVVQAGVAELTLLRELGQERRDRRGGYGVGHEHHRREQRVPVDERHLVAARPKAARAG